MNAKKVLSDTNNLLTSLYKGDKLFVEDKNIFIPISLIFSRKESKITTSK